MVGSGSSFYFATMGDSTQDASSISELASWAVRQITLHGGTLLLYSCHCKRPSRRHSCCRSSRLEFVHREAPFALRTATVDIPGVLKSGGKAIINEFNGEPFHIARARRSGSFEFTYAEIGQGTTSVTGDIEMAFEDSWAHYCVHHFNQDGLIRDRSRLSAWLGPGPPKGAGLDVAQTTHTPDSGE